MALRFKNWRFLFTLTAVIVLLAGSTTEQTVVDKTVATVSDGATTELITYSDLVWELALHRDIPLDPPSSENLRGALQILIDQRIFTLEAKRLPNPVTNEDISVAIKEILDGKEILKGIPIVDFEKRLRMVGFESVSDDSFENIIRQRVLTKKYVDFRFRSFVVITADDETKYYRDVWVPEFQRLNRGEKIVPSLDTVRADVNKDLVEVRVALSIETFLEEAKRRVEVVILSEIK